MSDICDHDLFNFGRNFSVHFTVRAWEKDGKVLPAAHCDIS